MKLNWDTPFGCVVIDDTPTGPWYYLYVPIDNHCGTACIPVREGMANELKECLGIKENENGNTNEESRTESKASGNTG